MPETGHRAKAVHDQSEIQKFSGWRAGRRGGPCDWQKENARFGDCGVFFLVLFLDEQKNERKVQVG